ncbi:hypothetical protein D9M72_392710 [compost metagenome]
MHVLAGQRHEQFDKKLQVNVKEGMTEYVQTGDSRLETWDGKRYESYKTGWDRKVLGGGGLDEITGGLTETIKGGDHVSTVTEGNYTGKAKVVTIEATAGDVNIKASGDFLFEGNHVKRVNRFLLWDWSPTAITMTGISSGTFGVNNSNSLLANFNNLTQVITAGVKFDRFSASASVGVYTQTVTAVHRPNPGVELNVGAFHIFAKSFFGVL